MRDFKTSEFKKAIGITIEDYELIDNLRGKKSKAGMLREIIKFYKDNEKRTYINKKVLIWLPTTPRV